MGIDVEKLVFALWNEHKQRTGHESGKLDRHGYSNDLHITCDVCQYLRPLMQEAEAAYYESTGPQPSETEVR